MNGVVLKASAGTGKTYRLSLEYLATLLRGESYKDILVMTFTKKATSEIQDRVIEFLIKMFREKDEELYENIKKLYPDLDLSNENVKKVYYEVLDNKDRLKIFTIDGFINNIFKNVIAPYLNIFSYEIIDDIENTEILLKCFEKIVQERDEFEKFKMFLQNRTERNIENYLDILRKLIDNRWKMILLQENEVLTKKEKYDESISIENVIDYLLETFVNIRMKKKEEDKPLSNYISKTLNWVCDLEREKYKEIALENWNEILKGEKCWDGRRVKTTKKVDLDSELEVLQEGFKDLKKEISKAIFNSEILPFEKEVLSFTENLYKIYDSIKFSEKKFTHLDISSYLFNYIGNEDVNLLKDGKITQYFKDVFDSEFKTVFIDEFQDTSILQWKILRGLINQCETLICVGDEKQSIYGWRGGEKALFENLSNIIEVSEETMSTSYRSCKNIVDFTNFVFKVISEAYEDDEINKEMGYTWNFTDVDGKSPEEGYVEVITESSQKLLDDEEDDREYLLEDDPSEEDIKENMMETLVDSLEENFSENYGDIAIIARSNAQLRDIAFILGERKIPFVIESNESIIYHRAVNPIYKLIKYIVLKDELSLFEFLRSDVVNIDNIQLKYLLTNREIVEKYLCDNLENEDEIKNYEFSEYVLEVLKDIRKISKDLDNKNIVIDIIEKFSICSVFKSKSDLKNIFSFLELSKIYGNIVDFYKDLKEEKNNPKFKQVSLEENNAVTLMSIHKSKGLEFETVYYYHESTRKGFGGGVDLYIDFKEPFEKIINFTFIDKKYEKALMELDKDYEFMKELELKNDQEEINGIYVALTRAKKNLFVVKGKTGNRYFEEAIESLKEKKVGKIFKKSLKESLENISEEFIKKNIPLNLKESPIEECELPNRGVLIDVTTEEKRIVGKAIHYYLEYIIHNEPHEHIEARKNVFSKYASIIGEKRLQETLDKPEFRKFFLENEIIFDKRWDYIYPEYEIYYEEDKELKRIDRLMIKKATKTSKGRILIVDYKTGGIDQEQLDKYIYIVKDHIEKLKKDGYYINEEYDVKGAFLEIKL